MHITLPKEYINSAVNSLDFYSRIFIGQYTHLNMEIRMLADSKKTPWAIINAQEEYRKILFKKIRDILLPDISQYDMSGSRGIWNAKNDPRAIDAYDLQQVIRFVNAWFLKPEGDYSVCFNSPIIEGRYPKIDAKIIGTPDDYSMDIELLPEQLQIMEEAAEVYVLGISGKTAEMFTIFTSDEDALAYAKEVEKTIPEYAKYAKKVIDDCAEYRDFLGGHDGNDTE